MSETHTLTVAEGTSSQRLDKWLTAQLPEISRAQVQRLISEGQVTLDGNACTNASRKVAEGNVLTLEIPEAEPLALEAVKMDLEILYEDDDVIVINKPVGLTVHPAPSERNATLVHGLLHHCGDTLSGIGGVQRPGIVHRLDKDTSGAIIVAKNDHSHAHLSAQLKDRSLSRTYHALAYSLPNPTRGTIEGDIGRNPKNRKKMTVLEENGKPARTHYQVLERYVAPDSTSRGLLSLVECKLESGRTHQIRVHMSHIGHALVGDTLYGRARKLVDENLQKLINSFTRQALHAVELKFIHPRTEEEVSCKAPYADDFAALMETLRQDYK